MHKYNNLYEICIVFIKIFLVFSIIIMITMLQNSISIAYLTSNLYFHLKLQVQVHCFCKHTSCNFLYIKKHFFRIIS